MLAGTALAAVLLATLLMTGPGDRRTSGPAGSGGTATSAAPTPASRPFAVLQLNLCNSGRARCYTGGALDRAVDLVGELDPDVVSLVEVCRDDVGAVRQALAGTGTGDDVREVFRTSADRPSAGPTRCTDGQEFGVGLAVRVPDGAATTAQGGTFAAQDRTDPEIRVWACLTVADRFRACVAHLAAAGGPVALAQCRELVEATSGPLPVVLAGDLNLLRDGPDAVGGCLGPPLRALGDGGVQYVVLGPGLTAATSRRLDLAAVTDHPGLLVSATLRPGPLPTPG